MVKKIEVPAHALIWKIVFDFASELLQCKV